MVRGPTILIGLLGDGPVDGYGTERTLAEDCENVRTVGDGSTARGVASLMVCIGNSQTEFVISEVLHKVLWVCSATCYKMKSVVSLARYWSECCLQYVEAYGTCRGLFG